jgi:hypothetical protein
MNKNINIIYIFIMDRPHTDEEKDPKKPRTTSSNYSHDGDSDSNDGDSDSNATASLLGDNNEGQYGTPLLDEGSNGTPPIPPLYDKSDDEKEEEEADEEEEEEAESEEGGLSQEDKELLSLSLFQHNEDAEEAAIDEVVSDVEYSQSQAELSQSQSQEVIQAIGSHGCEGDEEVVQQVQQLENRLISHTYAVDRIGQLYIELLTSMGENIHATGENIHQMLIDLKLAIKRMMTSTTATAMFEQINRYVFPLVRTVATTCVGYYLGSYLLRYVGGILTTLLARHTTITLVSLGSAGVHIVYNVGTREGGSMLDQVVAAANANIETFLTGVSRISNVQENMQANVHETMLENTLAALTNNVQQAINEAREEQQKGEMANILIEIGNLDLNDIEFQTNIQNIQDRLNKLMAPVEVADNNNEEKEGEEDEDENSGGKRVKRNKTKKTKAKKTVKRKAKKVKKTKKAKKAKKTVKRKAKKAKST